MKVRVDVMLVSNSKHMVHLHFFQVTVGHSYTVHHIENIVLIYMFIF
jgi:hypothetical protein